MEDIEQGHLTNLYAVKSGGDGLISLAKSLQIQSSRPLNSHSHNEPRVRLYIENQHTIEEIAQNIPKERKREIEK
ncbi:unnamed protein product [Rotaria sordida]|uniref:Uncharacterized protein n=1 Tax=Rotaria sordida TaxID=392033 RepID=A0A819FHR1_9BILA|nr:unnamed protein product [Rotaria sordida]CAF1152784.1 unnamed protein product [Rotaria sordida]CAF3825855.1 unnamed protein product [Rotaria sordida]CAF3868982.1 unnamed protein product [Rotaria sordida]